MRKGIGPRGLGAAKSPAKQTIGGKSLKEVNSAADVPKSTSFGGSSYNLGKQDGAGAHYYDKDYSSKHGRQGTIKRPGDKGIYHVSREVVEPINIKKKPIPNLVKSPAKQTERINKMGPQVDDTPTGRGQETRTVDKIKSAVQAPFSGKTYGELKKGYRAEQKAEHKKQVQKRRDWANYHIERI